MVSLNTVWQYLALQSPLQLHSTMMSGDSFNLIKMGVTTFALPALPYAYDALEPHISAQIMELHHGKHHQTYVTNLNKALESHIAAVAAGDVAAQIALQQVIKFNGGGHINHSLFWQNLAPAGSDETKLEQAKELVAAIERTWGGFDTFKNAFSTALLEIQGSGWGWLTREAGSGGGLRIVTTKDQDPVVGGDVVIFGVDMWEHAYYLQYMNGKAAYVENIWNVINWKTAEDRFLGRSEEKNEL
ncbi:manganese and iron superoxide dismutase [Parathielavia appendiculata]|uniref:Superoxide dismutase n=1 Tax=Parathielavia appendiculata TaxID=2587402 RepID=A0AAN6TR95_9PEZI|nr:manganese and iron superoxide dismutase [Parathielavia appendiculata]